MGPAGPQGIQGPSTIPPGIDDELERLRAKIQDLEREVKKYVFNRPHGEARTTHGMTGGRGATGAAGADGNPRRDIIMQMVDDGPLIEGAYREIVGGAWPTSVVWYTDSTKVKKLAEKVITRNSANAPTQIIWRSYHSDGVTVHESVTDTIVNTGTPAAFEASRTRSVSLSS
jgi:hypothetical protein